MEFDPKITGGMILPKTAERSRLGDHLAALKDPETGHIMVTPSQAAEFLLDYLVSEHRITAEEGPHPDIDLAPGSRSFAVVEGLNIARKAQGQEKIDLTQILETFIEERETRNREYRKKMDHLNVIGPKSK